MIPRNIDVFNRIVATCMLRLYETFPVPLDLQPSNIVMQAITEEVADEEEWFSILTEQASAAIEFLAKEGFLRYRADFRSMDSDTFPQAQLTMKGLAILGEVPVAVDESKDRRTLAEQLREGIHSGAEQALKNTVSTMFSAALGIGFVLLFRPPVDNKRGPTLIRPPAVKR